MFRLFRYCTLSVLLLCVTCLHSQVVTLVGKQFKDENGNPFYPVVCNYILDYGYDLGSSSYFLMPHHKYGTTWLDDCSTLSECQNRIQEDFHEIKLMGFNTIRLVGSDPVKKTLGYATSTTSPVDYITNFAIQYEEFPNPTPWEDGAAYHQLVIYPPYDSSNPDLMMIFSQLEVILSMAEAEGLKIILVTGGGNFLLSNTVVTSDQQANDYANLLSAYSDYFSTNSTIMAYDLFNEPHYTDLAYPHEKHEICDWTTSWYNAIKSNDPNKHLVTMGTGHIYNLWEWDPAVMKLDFLSEHIYPSFDEKDDYANISMKNRYHDIISWISKNSPMPWIIGETGFAASNGANSSYPPDPVIYNFAPYVWGTENDQADFAEFSLNDVRDAGSSGFSWWQFQDVFWFGPPDGPGPFKENWFGLLRYADPGPTGYAPVDRKQLTIDKFQNFDPLMTGAFPPVSSNYYDPFEHNAYNPSHTNAVTGVLLDQNGNPIEDALVEGLNFLEKIDNTPSNPFDFDFDYKHSWIYTFTKDDGSFELIPYNHVTSSEDRIVHIQGSAMGAERFERVPWPWKDIQMSPANVGTITLNKFDFGYDKTVDGAFVPVSTTQNFKAWNSMSISNTIIDGIASAGGTSSITARNEIHITGEFHARHGSEVHIFLSESFPSCENFSAFAMRQSTIPQTEDIDENDNLTIKEIELLFQKKNIGFVVKPNPATDVFSVTVLNAESATLAHLHIRNAIGNIIANYIFTGEYLAVNTQSYPPGIYFIEIKISDKTFIEKLIIN